MNGTLNEHLEIKNPSTGDARDMLHIGDQPSEITRYDLNYAGNTYLVALQELAALRFEIAQVKEERDAIESQLAKILVGVYIHQNDFNSEEAGMVAALYWENWSDVKSAALKDASATAWKQSET